MATADVLLSSKRGVPSRRALWMPLRFRADGRQPRADGCEHGWERTHTFAYHAHQTIPCQTKGAESSMGGEEPGITMPNIIVMGECAAPGKAHAHGLSGPNPNAVPANAAQTSRER